MRTRLQGSQGFTKTCLTPTYKEGTGGEATYCPCVLIQVTFGLRLASTEQTKETADTKHANKHNLTIQSYLASRK